MTDRYHLLGVARVRSPWFGEVARWANAARIPADFTKCLTVDEVRSRLRMMPVSAVLADAATPGLDRATFDEARSRQIAVIVIADPRAERDWATLGAAATLPPGFDVDSLLTTLEAVAEPITPAALTAASRAISLPGPGEELIGSTDLDRVGGLVAVCGRPGAGASSLAIGLAQGLAARPVNRGAVALADLALDSEQALYHDAVDLVPGLEELVDAHRYGQPEPDAIRQLLRPVESRRYAVLLGLRQHRGWTALASPAIHAALHGLCHSYRWVVADITADFEGEAETGSIDVEERNELARRSVALASVVVVVGDATLSGLRALPRLCRELVALGVDPEQVLPVVNRGPRTRRGRAEVAAAMREADLGRVSTLAVPLFLPERGLEAQHHEVDRLPPDLVEPLTAAVEATALRGTFDAAGNMPGSYRRGADDSRTGDDLESARAVGA